MGILPCAGVSVEDQSCFALEVVHELVGGQDVLTLLFQVLPVDGASLLLELVVEAIGAPLPLLLAGQPLDVVPCRSDAFRNLSRPELGSNQIKGLALAAVAVREVFEGVRS